MKLLIIPVLLSIVSWQPEIERQTTPIPPPRAAETACHMDLAALGRTLPYVPMNTHERLAAHRWLRWAYATPDDAHCRRIGGMIVARFILRNAHGMRS